MAQLVRNEEAERVLRECLQSEGFRLSKVRKNGETGTDIQAQKDGEEYFIEVIGFKESPPARSKDFYEVFFHAVSRLKDGATNLVIALPERFGNGLHQRAAQYGDAWRRIGNAFPELQVWLIRTDAPYAYSRSRWNDWLDRFD